MAGEYGAVYQAAGWLYLGQGLDGGKGRKMRYFFLAPGADPAVKKNWKTSRDLRRGKLQKLWDYTKIVKPNGKEAYKSSIWAQARARGFKIRYCAAKHVYAINVGRDRKGWRKDIIANQRERFGLPLRFPAPRPELKRKRFELMPPVIVQASFL